MAAASKVSKATPARPAEPEIPDTLSPDELARLLAAVTGSSKTALRDRALLMVAHNAALRASEIVKLRPGDVDVTAGNVNVRNSKRGRSRLIRDCLDPVTKQALAAWMTKRETLGWDDRSAYLFGVFYSRPGKASGDNSTIGKGGGQLDTSHLRRLIPALAKKARIKKDPHPHLLRHTRAREWSDMGLPVADIQQALGHRNLATTSIYLARLAPAGMGAGQHGRRSLDTGSNMEVGGR